MSIVGGGLQTGDLRNQTFVPTAKTGATTTTDVATPTVTTGAVDDKVQLATAPPNPFKAFADHAGHVVPDKWRKGPNDSMEHILRNNGYSLQEIYHQDHDGKTMLDHVSSVNNLKDPNLLVTRKDRPLLVPFKNPPAKAANADPAPVTVEQPAPPPPPPPVVAKTEPVPAPATQPVTKPADDNVEVGMLVDGVKDKRFNRDEFQALNSTANQYTELRARYAKDGFTPDETKQLAQVQQQYGQMFQRFSADDKAKISFTGQDDQSPAAKFHTAQNEEGGQIFDKFQAGTADEAATRAALAAQREASAQRGNQVDEPMAPLEAPAKHGFFYRMFHHKPHDAQATPPPDNTYSGG